jgi:AbrB family looped-hinge helix DNA binding protein
MTTITLSPKYQIAIPKALREAMGLKAGEKMAVYQSGEKIELMRVKHPKELAGSLKGIKNTFKRDKDRSL